MPTSASFRSFDLVELDVTSAHGYLLSGVGPRPIAWASTVDADGRPNLAPFSYFNVFSTRPPLLIFSPNHAGRTGAPKDTYLNVKAVPEVVINVVTYGLAEHSNLTSAGYGHGVNEFDKAGLTPLAAETVRPFRVAESPVQFECRVRQVIELGSGGGAGNLVLCEVQRLHVAEAVLDSEGRIDIHKLDLVGRWGGPYYVRAHGEAIFALQRPTAKPAVGIDGLPDWLRAHPELTGRELAALAGAERLPTPEELATYRAAHPQATGTTAELRQVLATEGSWPALLHALSTR